jgi:hypothetical protein
MSHSGLFNVQKFVTWDFVLLYIIDMHLALYLNNVIVVVVVVVIILKY